MSAIRVRIAVVFLILAAALPATEAGAQQHPNLERGFKPERVYNFTGLDTVNVFNGNLNVKIPLGLAYPNNGGMSWSLAASYNSKLWDYDEVVYKGVAVPEGTEYMHPIPSKRSNAGFGWLISFGRLLSPTDPARQFKFIRRSAPHSWIYESPDGADFEFGGTGNLQSTRDGSHLRMKVVDAVTRIVQFPNGAQHTFVEDRGRYRLKRMEDAFGNFVRIDYTYSGDQETAWTITDAVGRTAVVQFRMVIDPANTTRQWWVVGELRLPAFGGGTANYVLEYDVRDVALSSCAGFIPPEAPFARTPMLMRIVMPDSTRSRFTFSYNELASPNDCNEGTLRSMTLPTGGVIDWTYRQYILSSANCYDHHVNTSTGVHLRTLRNFNTKDGTAATWQYIQRRNMLDRCDGGCGPRPERPYLDNPNQQVPFAIHSVVESTTTVIPPHDPSETTPAKTVHYFSTMPDNAFCPINGEEYEARDYGLPFTKRLYAEHEGKRRYLSTMSYDDAGEHVRSTYVRYERDTEPLGVENENPRTKSESTFFRYRDASGNWTQDAIHVERSDYDGYGHYRLEETIPSAGFGPRRSVYTGYNIWNGVASGPFPMVSGPLPDSNQWNLGMYNSTVSQEQGTPQTSTTTAYCFDPATGAMEGKRIYKGATESADDVVVRYEHGANGNVLSEKWYGGDAPRPAGPLPTLCGEVTGTPSYERRYTYEHGLLASEKVPPFAFDWARYTTDFSTGLLSGFTDTSGKETKYRFDALGRLTYEEPPDGAPTSFVYTSGTTEAAPPRVDLYRTTRDGSTILTRSQIAFDLFGRVAVTRELMADGSMSVRETRYDGEGRKGEITEAAREGSRGGATRFSYDPFNRPLEITSPDGDARHSTLFTYRGTRYTDRTVSIGQAVENGAIVERPATTREEYDAYGRLVAVTEDYPSGPTTTYKYDVAGRLRQVHTSRDNVAQTRQFDYDGRGFLTEERHPELTGATKYSEYDPKGHARLKEQGTSTLYRLRMEFDPAERLRRVLHAGTQQVLKELWYDDLTAVDPPNAYVKNGMLLKSWRLNETASVLGSDTTVTEYFKYDGVDARLSDKVTAITPGPTFRMKYGYDLLGNVTSIEYPKCDSCGGVVPPIDTLSHRYTNGFLTEVVDFTSGAIQYHANGMPSRVVHANGVIDETAIASHGMVRPQSITFSNWSTNDCVSGVSVAPQRTFAGHPATLVAVHTPGSGVTYEWRAGPIGTLGDVLGRERDFVVTPSATMTYWVQVSDACGQRVSAQAVVEVTTACTPTTITIPPADRTVAPNTDVQLKVVATGVNLSYAWRRQGDSTVLGTSSTINVQPSVTTIYEVTVSSGAGCGSATATATVTVMSSCATPAPPSVKTETRSTRVVQGTSVTLIAKAPFASRFQWRTIQGLSFIDIPGATSPVYTFVPPHSGQYHVRAWNSCGEYADSEQIFLHVVPPVAGDFNRDGLTDIVWRDYAPGDLVIWDNISEFTVAGEPIPRLYQARVDDPAWRVHAVGDLDGDTRPDLVWRHNVSGANALWRWTGSNFADPVALDELDSEWKLQGAADFNNDARADLVFRNYRTGAVQLWLMNGTQKTAVPLTLPEISGIVDRRDPSWKIQAVGLFDGDAIPDLVWRHARDNRNAAWFLDAQYGVRQAVTLPAADSATTRLRGAGDFDGDGFVDLLWTRSDVDRTGFYWRRNSPGSATDWSHTIVPVGNAPMIAGSDPHVQGTGDYDACAAPDARIESSCRAAGGYVLTAAGGPAGSTYLWTRNGSAIGTSIAIDATLSGEYVVTITTPDHCTATASRNVTVHAAPAITASSELFCAGGSITLTAAGGNQFAWSGPGVPAGAANQPSITVTVAGTYSVAITDAASGCTRTATRTLSASSAPEIQGHPTSHTSGYLQTVGLDVWAPGAQSAQYDWYEGVRGDQRKLVQSGPASAFTTPPLLRTTRYWVLVRNACGAAESNEAVITVPDAPRLHAAADSSGTRIVVSWTPVAGATQYVVERMSTMNAGFAVITTQPGTVTSFTDDVGAAPTGFLYRVRTVVGANSSPWSNADLAAPVAFTNEPLVARVTRVQAVHLAELRRGVNAVRATAGLAAMSGTAPQSGDIIRASHIEVLRAGLHEALERLAPYDPSLLPPVYDDAPLAVRTIIRRVHVQQLRERLK